MKSGVSGWLANRANVFLVFPVGVFLKQNVHVSFVLSRHNLSFMVLCCTMYPLYCGSIDQGLHLSLQKLAELLGNYTCYMGCVVYILISGLSPFLLAPKSGVSFV